MLTLTVLSSRALAGAEPYLEQGARVLTQLDHVHVGVETSFGASFGPLSLGFATVYRPAGWSAHRLPHDLLGEQQYKGQSALALGSQFGWFGIQLCVTPLQLGRAAIDVPLTVGYGFLGTPLMGADRETPDGRRVSAWENELLDEMDFTGAPAIDLGLRGRLAPGPHADWFGLFAAVYASTFLGYAGPVASPEQLRGLSMSAGISLGR